MSMESAELRALEDSEAAKEDTFMSRLLRGEDMTMEEMIRGQAETQLKVMKLIYG